MPRYFLAAFVFAVFTLTQQGVAVADGGRSEDVNEHISCVGADALTNVSSISNVASDSKLQVTFTVAPWCDDVLVGLTASTTPQNNLVSQQTGTFAKNTTNTLTIATPACAFKVDLYAGTASDIVATTTKAGKNCDVAPVSQARAAAKNSESITPVAVNEVTATTSTTAVPSTTSTTAAPVATELAATGFNTKDLSVFGSFLLMMGSVLRSLARR